MVDHYRVIRPLGKGGMAEVYLARDTMLGRKIALKIIHPKRIGNKELVERFLFEAKTTALFNHPNIITIYGVGMTSQGPYLALEFLEGQTLRERLMQEQLSFMESVRIGKAIAEALATAHQKEILHRDLKPDNTMLVHDGQLRVLDFGLARLLGERQRIEHQTPPEPQNPASFHGDWFMTKEPGILGTPAYLAPEQWQEEEIGPATDIWALGLILYEMLFGFHPYRDAGSLQSLEQLVTSPDPVELPVAVGHISINILELLEQCLAKDPAERPEASEVATILDQQLADPQQNELTGRSPFRGLSVFEEDDSPLYYGREAEVTSFVEKLRREPILPLIGPSGAGKSSFIRAGVIPRLRERGPLTLIQMRPGREPFLALASRFVGEWQKPHGEWQPSLKLTSAWGAKDRQGEQQQVPRRDDVDLVPAIKELADKLYEQPNLLGVWLHRLAERHRSQVVLFVDQLEELCALTHEDKALPWSSLNINMEMGTSAGVLQRFMRAIVSAADDAFVPVRVILTVREEFLTRLMVNQPIREALSKIIALRRPSPKTLVEILIRSVKAVGYQFEEIHLPYELVEDVADVQACFPLLQFAGQMMWQQRDKQRKLLTNESYLEMGGVTGALVQHADGVLKGLTEEEVGIARTLLLRLVTEDRTRRIISRPELLAGLPVGAQRVLNRLVESRLLIMSRKNEEEQGDCEIIHEALIAQWDRLSHWLDESREELKLRSQLAQAADLWKKRGCRVDDLWSPQALREVAGIRDYSEQANKFIRASHRLNRNRRLRSMAIYFMVAGLLGSAVWTTRLWWQSSRQGFCLGSESKFVGSWDLRQKEKIRKAFLSTQLPYAEDTWDRVAVALDRYRNNWVSARTAACQATMIRGEQTEQMMDLKMACLATRLTAFRELSHIFSNPDPKVLEKAVRAVAALAPIEHCTNETALTSQVKPPAPGIINRVQKLHEQLVKTQTQHSMGIFRPKQTARIVSQARKIEYVPLLSQALFLMAEQYEEALQLEEAEKTLTEVIRQAASIHFSDMLAKAYVKMVWLVGYKRARHEEGFANALAAEAFVSFAQNEKQLYAKLLSNMGSIYASQGDYLHAQQMAQKALTYVNMHFRPDDPQVATTINNLGIAYGQLGDDAQAAEYLGKAVEKWTATLGRQHPQRAISMSNLGNILSRQGKYKQAIEMHEQAYQIQKKVYGEKHGWVGFCLVNFANSLLGAGRLQQAKTAALQARAIFQKIHGPQNFQVTSALDTLGNIDRAIGNLSEAVRYYEQTKSIFDRSPATNQVYIALEWTNLARVDLLQSNSKQALVKLDRALALLEKEVADNHPDVAEILVLKAQALMAGRNNTAATPLLEKAYAILSVKRSYPGVFARCCFLLAKLRWDVDQQRALELANLAQQTYSAIESTRWIADREQINQWIKEKQQKG